MNTLKNDRFMVFASTKNILDTISNFYLLKNSYFLHTWVESLVKLALFSGLEEVMDGIVVMTVTNDHVEESMYSDWEVTRPDDSEEISVTSDVVWLK